VRPIAVYSKREVLRHSLYYIYICISKKERNESSILLVLFLFIDNVYTEKRTEIVHFASSLSFHRRLSLSFAPYIYIIRSHFFSWGYSISRIQLLGLPTNSTIHYNEDWINRFPGPFDFQVNRLFLQFHIIYEVGTNVLLVRFRWNSLSDFLLIGGICM